MPHDLTANFIALQTALAGEYSLDCELGRGGMGIDAETPTNDVPAAHV